MWTPWGPGKSVLYRVVSSFQGCIKKEYLGVSLFQNILYWVSLHALWEVVHVYHGRFPVYISTCTTKVHKTYTAVIMINLMICGTDDNICEQNTEPL